MPVKHLLDLFILVVAWRFQRRTRRGDDSVSGERAPHAQRHGFTCDRIVLMIFINDRAVWAVTVARLPGDGREQRTVRTGQAGSTQTEILNFERSDEGGLPSALAGVKTFFACAIVVALQYTSALFSPSAQNMYVPYACRKNDFPFFTARGYTLREIGAFWSFS